MILVYNFWKLWGIADNTGAVKEFFAAFASLEFLVELMCLSFALTVWMLERWGEL